MLNKIRTSLRGVKRRSNLLKRLPRHVPDGTWLAMTLMWIPAFAGMTSEVYACGTDETQTDFGCISSNPTFFASSLYGIGLTLVGGVALLSIIYGAFLVLSSQGDSQKLNTGKSYIVYALIGLFLAVGGYAFYRIIAANIIQLPGFK